MVNCDKLIWNLSVKCEVNQNIKMKCKNDELSNVKIVEGKSTRIKNWSKFHTLDWESMNWSKWPST